MTRVVSYGSTVLLLFWFSFANAQDTPQPGWHVVQIAGPGCRHQENFTRFTKIFETGDRPSWQNFLLSQIVTGECFLFKKGTEVHIDERGSFWSAVTEICARPRGENTCYWTYHRILEPLTD